MAPWWSWYHYQFLGAGHPLGSKRAQGRPLVVAGHGTLLKMPSRSTMYKNVIPNISCCCCMRIVNGNDYHTCILVVICAMKHLKCSPYKTQVIVKTATVFKLQISHWKNRGLYDTIQVHCTRKFQAILFWNWFWLHMGICHTEYIERLSEIFLMATLCDVQERNQYCYHNSC
jgi:hypothetical protein